MIERLDGVDLALLDLPDGGVEHFERARHLQRHQAFLDAVEQRGIGMDRHHRPPEAASPSPIA
jgi:hypothetical protein